MLTVCREIEEWRGQALLHIAREVKALSMDEREL